MVERKPIGSHVEMDDDGGTIEVFTEYSPDPFETPVDDRTYDDAVALRQELGLTEDPILDSDFNIQSPYRDPF